MNIRTISSPAAAHPGRSHAVKHSIFCISALCLLLLNAACGRKPMRVTTKTLEMDMRHAYESCLLDEGGEFEFHSNQEFTSILEGRNPRGIRYLGLTGDMRDQDGQAIDEWGRPFRITRPGKNKLEIRSAGKDSIFGTADDIVTLHPPVPGPHN